jgi:alkanesulfonate monooxygenase SsuD/methylene tetrahydromethanopterin reductase-like flavin-dependent oxidoreductase (luciferase family)
VGQGYRDIEFRSFGVEKSSRRQRMVEGIQAIRKLWAEDNVTFHGEFFRFDGVSISAKPVQRPGPSILVGADQMVSVSQAAETGDHWVVSPRHSKIFLRKALPVYKAALERLGRPFQGLPMIRELCVARRAEEAEERIKLAFEDMYHLYHRWGQPGERYDLGFEELKRERLVVGNPEEVVEQIMSYHEEFGAEFMFGEEVIPEIKRLTPPSQIP